MYSAVLLGDALVRKSLWQIIKFKGKPILLHAIEALQNSKVDEIILVVGKDYHQILNKVKFEPRKVRIVMNRRYDRGMSSYVRAGINMISPASEGVLVVRGEFPLIKSSLIDRLIDFFKEDEAHILVPTYESQQGQPVIYDKSFFHHIKRIVGNDIGGSILTKYKREVKFLEVKNPGVIKGIEALDILEGFDTDEIDREEKEAGFKDTPVTPASRETVELRMEEKPTIRVEADFLEKQLFRGQITTEIQPETPEPEPEPQQEVIEKSKPAEMTIEQAIAEENARNAAQAHAPAPELSLKMLNDLLSQKGKKPDLQQIKGQAYKNAPQKPNGKNFK
ncbi:MAG: nucleotidyltransferase family protein [Firmicutes bacterium]|nr:nucleotidyltransferase family protein [Bacillota bacterium]